MSHTKLVRFDKMDTTSVVLPAFDTRWTGGTSPTQEAIVTVADGSSYDSWGTNNAPSKFPYILSYNFQVAEDSYADMQTTMSALFSLQGQYGKLYRERLDDNTFQWAWARVLQVQEEHQWLHSLAQPLTMQFQIQSNWHSHLNQTWYINDGNYLNTGLYLNESSVLETMTASPHTLTLTNLGNATLKTPVLTITAGDVQNITSITLAVTGATSLTWTGTLVAGNSLVLDCGAKSIKNNGVNAWSGLAYNAAHVINTWLELEAATDTDVIITFAQGAGTDTTDPTVLCEYWNAWK